MLFAGLSRPAPAPPKKRGPKTAAGKARSRQNALRHGFRATLLEVPLGEEQGCFKMLVDRLRRSLAPEDATETELVDALAVAMWKEIRADRLEVDLLESFPSKNEEPFHATHLTEVDGPGRRATLATIIRYQTAAGNATRRSMDLFLKYRRAHREGLVEGLDTNEFPPSPPTPEPPPAPPAPPPAPEKEAAGSGSGRGRAETPARGEAANPARGEATTAACTNEFPPPSSSAEAAAPPAPGHAGQRPPDPAPAAGPMPRRHGTSVTCRSHSPCRPSAGRAEGRAGQIRIIAGEVSTPAAHRAAWPAARSKGHGLAQSARSA